MQTVWIINDTGFSEIPTEQKNYNQAKWLNMHVTNAMNGLAKN